MTPAQLAPLLGAGLFGLMAGPFIFGPLADKVGRSPVVVATTVFFGPATLANSKRRACSCPIGRWVGSLESWKSLDAVFVARRLACVMRWVYNGRRRRKQKTLLGVDACTRPVNQSCIRWP